MRFIVLSDTHCLHRKIEVPPGDVLIHAGDFTSVGRTKEITDFNTWLGTLPHKYKIVIAGNHDLKFEEKPADAESLLTNAIYLNNSSFIVNNIKIWGSPVTPSFGNWAFNYKRGDEIKKVWDKIPDDTDILVTHGPPYGILDKTLEGRVVGCEELSICLKRVNPKYHIFGHIHEGYGILNREDTSFINCSVCTRHYSPLNKPIAFSFSK